MLSDDVLSMPSSDEEALRVPGWSSYRSSATPVPQNGRRICVARHSLPHDLADH